jgi:hypothetical protein
MNSRLTGVNMDLKCLNALRTPMNVAPLRVNERLTNVNAELKRASARSRPLEHRSNAHFPQIGATNRGFIKDQRYAAGPTCVQLGQCHTHAPMQFNPSAARHVKGFEAL